MPGSSRSFLQSSVSLLVIAFFALLVIVGTTFWLGERAQQHFDAVIKARDARAAAVDLQDSIQTAEASQRGFLLTGNEIYLAPFDRAKTLGRRQLAILRQAAGPYTTPEALDRLTAVVEAKIDEMDRTITLKRERREEEVTAIVRTNRGKALMDEANVFFSGIIRNADNHLTVSVGEQRANAMWLRWVSIGGGIVIIGVVMAVASTVLRYTRELTAVGAEITALNETLEERVNTRTAELVQANEEIQRFAYIVTHDLRAPLVNIMGFTSELERGTKALQALIEKSGLPENDNLVREGRIAATEDLPEAISFIRSSTRKMENLITAILKLSRAGQRTLRPETMNLAEVIKASVAAIRHQVIEADGVIETRVADQPIVSDRLSIEHIFGNILDNAVKYRSRSRPLRIEIRTEALPEDRIAVEIEDNGRGIGEHDRVRIFELFRRSGAQDQPGEGIGLAYVQTIVRNLGGNITVKSVVDQGTAFRIVLPLTMREHRGAMA